MHFDSADIYLYTLYWDYNPMGKLIREVDALQRVSEWRYDPNGNCIYEQGPDLNFHKELTYDFANRLVRQDEIHSDGVRRSVSYRYNLLSQPIAIKDCNGNETLYDYDAFSRVTRITYPPVMDEKGVLSSPTLTRSYDLMGNVTRLIDSKGNEKIMSYTIRGQVAKALYPDGSTESNTYNRDGLLQSSCAKNGTKTSYTYDILGRAVKTEITSASGEVLSKTSASYNTFHLTSEIDAMGRFSFYTYYPDGKLKSKQCGESVQSFTYDAVGRLKTSSENYGPNFEDVIIKTQEYDLLNRVVEERVEDNQGIIFTQVNTKYDTLGNVCETRSGNGSISSVIYDSHGTPTTTTDGEGNQVFIKRSYNYVNSIGQCVDYKEIIDALGNIITSTCDALGRSVSTTRKNRVGTVLQQQDIAYDLNGNRCCLIDTIISGSTERKVLTKWFYDALNRPIASYEAADTPEQKCTQINYNIFGQKSTCIKADGTSLNHTYDALGRLASIYSSDHTVHYVYTYDLNNHPLKIDDLIHNTSTLKKYDNRDRLIEEILGNGVSLDYSYDVMGRPKYVSLPDKTGCAFKYRGPFLEKVQRLSSENTVVYEHVYKNYDLSGRLTEASLIGKAGNINYGYDNNGRLKSAKATDWEESLVYDPVGNLVEQRLKDPQGDITARYSYNDLYQLLTESGVTSHDYQYDSLYNRTQKDNKIHVHNDLNQILNDGDANYMYDSNGNLLKKAFGNEIISFTYDGLDRLVSFTKADEHVRYNYDEANRRLSKEISHKGIAGEWILEKTIKYMYQGQNEIGSLNSEGKIAELRLLGIGKGAEIGAAIAMEIGEKIFAPIHNHAGHIAGLIEANTGENSETYRYSAFGEELFEDAITPWRFSSKRVDNESGLVYFGRRYYDPTCGRWISQDPIGRDGGPNLYAYVLNNPLTNCDAYGLHILPDRFKNCGESGFSRLFQAIGQGIRYACDTWQRQCPIPFIRDSFSAVHHLCTNGTLRGFKMEHQGTHSSNGKVYGLDLFENTAIIYVPGINNTVESTIESAQLISRAHADSTVYYTHNKDHGILSDIGETICQKVNIPTNSVDKLVEQTRARLNDVGPNGKILQYGFSQGGEILDSQKNHLTHDECKQLFIKTYGSAKMVPRSDFGDAINYVSFRDIIPWVSDPWGIFKSFFSDDIKIVFITSKTYPIIDHQFANDSYQSALKIEGQNCIDKYLENR